MSSLLKMNQKFLSKSSWSIRGGGGGGGSGHNSTNNNNNNNHNHHNNNLNLGNRIDFRFKNDGKQFSISPNNRPLNNFNSNHQSSNTNNNLTPNNRNNNIKHLSTENHHYHQQQQQQSSQKLPQSNDLIYSKDTLVNNNLTKPLAMKSQNTNLKRSKGISISITDLRDLKEKPKKIGNSDNDQFEREIKERRIDTYIAEIEMDPVFQLGSTIRAIYDGDEHDRFMEKLDLRIKNHDKDIERMCNCHYQGFVDCIHELLKVRPHAQELKTEIIQINQELLKSTENIERKAEELIKYRRVLCNTKTAIECLQECLPMLESFSKLNQQMQEKKYYSALKTLDQFESLYMPKIKKYRFAQTMCQRVPQIRETIKKESMKDLKDFLENIRQLTFKIGEIAMKNTAIRFKSKDFCALILNEDSENKILSKKLYLNVKKPNGLNYENGNEMNGMNENNSDEEDYLVLQEDLSATDLVDFSPVYRCLHIFGCLGARSQFESYYRGQRKQQARLILHSFSIPPSTTATNFNRENFRNYLFGVVGFFVIEDHLLNTSNGLVTKEYLVDNWNDVIKSLIESVHFQAKLCNDSEQMLYMKNLLMLFCETTTNYGYSVDDIMKLLVELRQLYTDILLKQWSLVFKKIFDLDNYHPLIVNNQKEFKEHFNELNAEELEMFKDNDQTIQKNIYPKKFNFSSFVPEVYRKVKEFIVVCLKFLEDLNLSDSDKEDTIRKSTNLLLTRTLSDSLSSLIKKPNLGLLQLIQISINTRYLEESSASLETFISKLIHLKNKKEKSSENFAASKLKYSMSIEPASMSHLARLQSRSMFKDSRSEAESQIYIQLNNKIEEFFSLANYDYMLSDSPGKASSYILDLMAFLKSTFEAFTNLPSKVAQTACLSACKFISSRLLNILVEDDVKSISHGFLQQFNLDLMQCEMFAGSEPVKEFEEGALQFCFAELRQTMDLFMEFDSWATYFAEYGKNESRYLRVNPQTALILLEKLVRGDNKKTIFSSLSKNERDKKNKIDTILRKLKQLINQQ